MRRYLRQRGWKKGRVRLSLPASNADWCLTAPDGRATAAGMSPRTRRRYPHPSDSRCLGARWRVNTLGSACEHVTTGTRIFSYFPGRPRHEAFRAAGCKVNWQIRADVAWLELGIPRRYPVGYSTTATASISIMNSGRARLATCTKLLAGSFVVR